MNWGVPDWKDASAYPEPDALSNRQWWWEFTRRCPEIRANWLRHAPYEHKLILDDHARLKAMADRNHCSIEEIVFNITSKSKYGNKQLLAKYGLRTLLNPTRSFSDDFLRHYHRNRSASLADFYSYDGVEEIRAEGRVIITFDLNRPLGKQLADAKSLLEFVQQDRFGKRIQRRRRKELWPLHLRALDAKNADAKLAEIAAVFWPGLEKTEQSARDAIDAAIELRDNFPI